MMSSRIRSSAAGIAAVAVLAFTLPAMPARADGPVFPTGSYIGLVPPPGMTPAKTFAGFIDEEKHAGILVGTLPLGAYEDMEKTLTDDALKKQGVTTEKRESLQLGIGKAILVIGTETGADKTKYRKWLLLSKTNDFTAVVTVQEPAQGDAYPDSVVRAALATLTERGTVPDAEFLSLLPFTIGDLAGFKVASVIPGRALLLIDPPKEPNVSAPQDSPGHEFDVRFTIALAPGGPANGEERANFARIAFGSIAGIKDIRITMSEPVRIESQQGFEIVAQAKDATTNTDLMVLQWLRFGSGQFLQMVGISRAEAWSRELARLRIIRDGVAFK
jgi:hypothetical protein